MRGRGKSERDPQVQALQGLAKGEATLGRKSDGVFFAHCIPVFVFGTFCLFESALNTNNVVDMICAHAYIPSIMGLGDNKFSPMHSHTGTLCIVY